MYTDHSPLLGVLSKDMADIANPRLRNSKEKLAQFDYTLKHVPGRKNGAADAMSQIKSQEAEAPDFEESVNTISSDIQLEDER